MDPRHRGHTTDKKYGAKGQILTDPRSCCLGHPKLTINSQNKSTDTEHTTILTDSRNLSNTRDQKHGSKARILMDTRGFFLGHPKLTIKSHNKSTDTSHNTIIMDPCHRGHTKDQKHGTKAIKINRFYII